MSTRHTFPTPSPAEPSRWTEKVAADVADAEAALIKVNLEASGLVDTEALARLLLRAESVASSRIEGLEVGPRRLLRAEVAKEIGDDASDVTATEVLGNIEAMQLGIDSVHIGDTITVDLILQIHKRLLRGSRMEEDGGHFRRAELDWWQRLQPMFCIVHTSTTD